MAADWSVSAEYKSHSDQSTGVGCFLSTHNWQNCSPQFSEDSDSTAQTNKAVTTSVEHGTTSTENSVSMQRGNTFDLAKYQQSIIDRDILLGIRRSDRARREKRAFSPDLVDTTGSPVGAVKRKKKKPVKIPSASSADRPYDRLPNGLPFSCDLCKSPYVCNPGSKRTAQEKRSRHMPCPRQKVDLATGRVLSLCNACGLAVDRPLRPRKQKESLSTEEKEKYLQEARSFAQTLADELKEPDAERLYCPSFKSKPCQCLQTYILADGDSVESKKRATFLLEILKEARQLSAQKCYNLEVPVESTKKSKKSKHIGLGNGQKKSKAFESYIMAKRIELRDELKLCERATQRVLIYSNNFLHKKLKTDERGCRATRVKGKAALGLLSPLSQLHKERCCVDNCVMMSLTHRRLLHQWRERAKLSQCEARRVLAEMLTPSGGARCNCYKFISWVTGCSHSTIARVADQMKRTGGDREPPTHGLKKYWQTNPKHSRPPNEFPQSTACQGLNTGAQDMTSLGSTVVLSSQNAGGILNTNQFELQHQQLLSLQRQLMEQQAQIQRQQRLVQQQLLQQALCQQLAQTETSTQNLLSVQQILTQLNTIQQQQSIPATSTSSNVIHLQVPSTSVQLSMPQSAQQQLPPLQLQLNQQGHQLQQQLNHLQQQIQNQLVPNQQQSPIQKPVQYHLQIQSQPQTSQRQIQSQLQNKQQGHVHRTDQNQQQLKSQHPQNQQLQNQQRLYQQQLQPHQIHSQKQLQTELPTQQRTQNLVQHQQSTLLLQNPVQIRPAQQEAKRQLVYVDQQGRTHPLTIDHGQQNRKQFYVLEPQDVMVEPRSVAPDQSPLQSPPIRQMQQPCQPRVEVVQLHQSQLAQLQTGNVPSVMQVSDVPGRPHVQQYQLVLQQKNSPRQGQNVVEVAVPIYQENGEPQQQVDDESLHGEGQVLRQQMPTLPTLRQAPTLQLDEELRKQLLPKKPSEQHSQMVEVQSISSSRNLAHMISKDIHVSTGSPRVEMVSNQLVTSRPPLILPGNRASKQSVPIQTMAKIDQNMVLQSGLQVLISPQIQPSDTSHERCPISGESVINSKFVSQSSTNTCINSSVFSLSQPVTQVTPEMRPVRSIQESTRQTADGYSNQPNLVSQLGTSNHIAVGVNQSTPETLSSISDLNVAPQPGSSRHDLLLTEGHIERSARLRFDQTTPAVNCAVLMQTPQTSGSETPAPQPQPDHVTSVSNQSEDSSAIVMSSSDGDIAAGAFIVGDNVEMSNITIDTSALPVEILQLLAQQGLTITFGSGGRQHAQVVGQPDPAATGQQERNTDTTK